MIDFDFDALDAVDEVATPKKEHASASVGIGKYWKVVHSIDAEGLSVNAGEVKSSKILGRLPLGSIVEEICQRGDRLYFVGVPDFYPLLDKRGWVSIKSSGPFGKELLKPLGNGWQPPNQEKEGGKNKTGKDIIFLDWDDTLCPTTWIQGQLRLCEGFGKSGGNRGGLRDEAWEELGKHALVVQEFIQKVLSLGTVAIVTSAQPHWVPESVKEFLPAAEEVVNRIEVYCACEQAIPTLAWSGGEHPAVIQKMCAMEQSIRELIGRQGPDVSPKWDSLMSIGDSVNEQKAAKKLGHEYQVIGNVNWTKTVKLKESPNIKELSKELRMLCDLIEDLMAHEADMDVDLRNQFRND